jgi:putative ABC transport system ATP-binding protein
MLKLNGVSKLYRSGDVETTALDRIELEIGRGEYVAVTGPSGCGKSTLLGILGLLDIPTEGDYVFDGESVSGSNEAKLARIRRGRVGFIFQSFNLIEDLSVEENVSLALEYANIPTHERKPRVAKALERLGVGHRAGHRPSQLSGGQQQRVAIARAIVSKPTLLLADEPTGNLDSAHGAEVMRTLREINGDGTTIVMVTHSPSHAKEASRVVRLLDGRVVNEAVPE